MEEENTEATWMTAGLSVGGAVSGGVLLIKAAQAATKRSPVSKGFMSFSWSKIVLLEGGYLSWIFGSVVSWDRLSNRMSTRETTKGSMLSEIFYL